MTGPTITEQRLGSTPWLVVRGERLTAFRALGEHARDQVGAILATIPDVTILRRRVDETAVARRHAAVADATRQQNPKEWAELTALAAGAGVSFDDLLLLNLRGDLGTDDGTGCSDIGYVGDGVGFIAHNEDGAAAQADRCLLLTLAIDGDVPVTCWWCPGFVPANTFVITGNGLAWGIDHIAVRQPAAAPGRHFVARAAQHETTLADVVRHLTTRHSAGGFSYTIGRIGHPEVTVVETAGTHSHVRHLGPERPLSGHTNHLRDLPSTLDKPYPNSVERARFLDGLTVPEHSDAAWFLSVLTGAPLLRDGTDGSPVTLATFVVDLMRAEVTIRPAGARPVRLPTADLVKA